MKIQIVKKNFWKMLVNIYELVTTKTCWNYDWLLKFQLHKSKTESALGLQKRNWCSLDSKPSFQEQPLKSRYSWIGLLNGIKKTFPNPTFSHHSEWVWSADIGRCSYRLNLDSCPTTRSSLRLVSVLLGHPPAQVKCWYRMIRLKAGSEKTKIFRTAKFLSQKLSG